MYSMPISNIEDLIGNTPLIRLKAIEPQGRGVEVYAKAEYMNPGGSVKDRPALNMIRKGESSGALTKSKTIIDATSGNTGIAYSMIGSNRGYKVKICLPRNASPERKKIMRAFGAELIMTNPAEQSDGAIRMVRKIVLEDPDIYFYPDQYNNDANWQAHFETTGPEIFIQTKGRITHFVAGLGTTGTMMGVGRYLRKVNPDVRLISLQPDSPFNGLEGLKHLETAIVPGIYKPDLADENMECRTEDAYAMVKYLAHNAGLLVGISSGANVYTSAQIAQHAISDSVIVTILCDGADRYLSDRFWDENIPEPLFQI